MRPEERQQYNKELRLREVSLLETDKATKKVLKEKLQMARDERYAISGEETPEVKNAKQAKKSKKTPKKSRGDD